MDIHILFEDDAILVVNKPAGVVVNRSDTTKGEETVQDWVLRSRIPLRGTEGKEQRVENIDTMGSLDKPEVFYKRAGIVHRLDKETSGILLIAKTPAAFFHLLRQFRERAVKKSYIALVHGKVTPKSGDIKAPLGRQTWNRKRFGVVAGGREALTHYSLIGYYKNANDVFSLLQLQPQTGRTHQIRVHVKYINHPIVADELYAGRKTARNDRKKLSRLFLHASAISFCHPKNNKEVHFEAPLPPDLLGFLNTTLEKLEDEGNLG